MKPLQIGGRNRSVLSAALAALLLLACLTGALSGCAKTSEVPEGYQYATCRGEYFRLFIPTQWTVSTESGVSGGYLDLITETAVSMDEVRVDGGISGDGQAVTATLDDFVRNHTETISSMTGYKAEKDFDTTLGNYRAKDITYAAELGKKSYRFRQVLTKVEGRFYLFTFSSLADYFDRYLDVVDDILENILFYADPFTGDAPDRKIPDDPDTPDGMKLVSTNRAAYRFYVPMDWKMDEDSEVNLVYASDDDRSNVSVISYLPESETYSVNDYWTMCETYYRDALRGYTLTGEPAEETMGGRKATVYEYTYTVGNVHYKTRQAVCVNTTMIYVMTYTALEDRYEAHLGEVRSMQEAFTFR